MQSNKTASDNRTLDRRAMLGLTASALAGSLTACSSTKLTQTSTPNRQRFKDKVVLITGATSGIGRCAAEQFAAEGAKVAFCGRREGLGHEVEGLIRQRGGEATYIRADVRKEGDVRFFVDETVRKYGRLDVAFNNAGVTLEKPLHEYTAEEWDDVLTTNLRGVFFAIKYEVPHMLANGGGNIVVTSSSNALATTEKRGAYTASKRGLVGLVQCAAFDYASKGIRINTLIPGTTDTELVRRDANMMNVPDPVWELTASTWAKSHVPGLQRMAKPEEIAAFALALASDDFPYMTGAQMVIDGGKTAHAG
jgi:NAD(P)-dependent dehydrogenase (short-subunit alcohol dehydrogenase family)